MTNEHNYLKKLRELVASGTVPAGDVHNVAVEHDDWCEVYKAGICNCSPNVYVMPK